MVKVESVVPTTVPEPAVSGLGPYSMLKLVPAPGSQAKPIESAVAKAVTKLVERAQISSCTNTLSITHHQAQTPLSL